MNEEEESRFVCLLAKEEWVLLFHVISGMLEWINIGLSSLTN